MGFPTSFPVAAIPTVIGYLRGTGVSRREGAEAAYDLLGYGAHLALPADGSGPLSSSTENGFDLVSDASLAVRLEDLKADLEANPNAAFSLPPWLVPILLEVLRRILAG